MSKKRVIVIGSGFGGLAVAARLAATGYEVSVFEKLDAPGGRAYTFKIGDFYFDGGPTVITAPPIFDEIFELAAKNREDYVEFIPVNPYYRIFKYDKNYLDYNGDVNFVLKQIEKFNEKDKQGYIKLLELVYPMFKKGFFELSIKPFNSFIDMLSIVPDLVRFGAHRSVYKFVSSLIQDDFLRRCFSFHPLLVGGNPFRASCIYSLIHSLEREWGVFYPKGGIKSLVNAFVKFIEELGGTFYFNSEVEEIIIENKIAKGIRLKNSKTFYADYIVCNSDAPYTYMKLINPKYRSFRNSDIRYKYFTKYSMSLVVIYFAVNKVYKDAQFVHHNIILTKRYKDLIYDIFDGKELPEDFSLYVHRPVYTDPSVCKEGYETFYVLSPVPNLRANIDWEKERTRYRDKILGFLEDNFLPDLRASIVAIDMIDPLYFRDKLNTYLGSGFSIEPNLFQAAYFRPHNLSEDIKNLYFVGAGTHPGAGVPGVLSSAKIVHQLIQKQSRNF